MQRPSLELTNPNPLFLGLSIYSPPFRFSETPLSWTQKRFLQELNIEVWVSGVTAKPQDDLGYCHLLLNNSCVAAYFAYMGSLSKIYPPLPFIPLCFVTTDVEYST